MKTNSVSNLISRIKEKKPIGVIFGGEDFGYYFYNEEKKRYIGVIGYIDGNGIKKILNTKDFFIKLY